mmetsp:Transcript_8289/g.12059  ORF Transcript_8289/g.12059 Transcript_8289/m.12059 type:complete len:84 (+) Transcript_8289:128-379(+)
MQNWPGNQGLFGLWTVLFTVICSASGYFEIKHSTSRGDAEEAAARCSGSIPDFLHRIIPAYGYAENIFMTTWSENSFYCQMQW